MRKIKLILAMSLPFSFLSQMYSSLQTKEEYDLFNNSEVNRFKPCLVSPENDQNNFGDGMAYMLEGYITMYKTTGDKGYLYKFLIQSLCIMENRHDIAGVNSDPRWSDAMYHDGNIIGSMAHFVHFIKNNKLSKIKIFLNLKSKNRWFLVCHFAGQRLELGDS